MAEYGERNRDLGAEMAALGRTADRIEAEKYMTDEQYEEYIKGVYFGTCRIGTNTFNLASRGVPRPADR